MGECLQVPDQYGDTANLYNFIARRASFFISNSAESRLAAYENSRTHQPGTFEKFEHGPRKVRKIRSRRIFPRDEHQVPSIFDVGRMRQSPQAAFDTVSDHRIANSTPDGETDSTNVRTVSSGQQHEQRVAPAPASSSRSSKIARLSQTAFFLHGHPAKYAPRHQAERLRGSDGTTPSRRGKFEESNSKSTSSLEHASLYYVATVS